MMDARSAPLPPIGAPATRALAAIGVARLDHLQDHRAADVLALHGVGPKAIATLRSALTEAGLSFSGESSEPPTTFGG